MSFYNIHTHIVLPEDEVISIYNLTPEEILEKAKLVGDNIYYSAGIHPWSVEDSPVDIELLSRCLSKDKMVAVGEVGLDKLSQSPFPLQIKIFEEQIKLAIDLNLPIIIHCVKAWDDLLFLFKKYKPNKPWVIHGFRGGLSQAEQLIKFGFKFSLGKYYNKEILKVVYPDSLLLETDDNEFSILNVYNTLSKDLGSDLQIVKEQIKQNVSLLFDF